MAQTKKKRRTKHRGTAAGTISNRGRTGRPPSAAERKKQSREQLREARLNKPPTWEGAIKRATLAAGLMFIFLLVTSKGNILAALAFGIFAMALYIPSGYYLELFLYRRRMRKREGAKPR
jgi:hypothetical protein